MPISEPVTPSTTRRPRPSSLRKPWNPANLKILPSTPVSARPRDPFTPLTLNVHSIKRKLFTPIPAPSKKKFTTSHSNHHKSPHTPRLAQFRVTGGKERTQPVDLFLAKKRSRAQSGPFTAQLLDFQRSAELNMKVLRSALLAPRVDVKEIGRLLARSLVLKVLRREDNVFIAYLWNREGHRIEGEKELSVVMSPNLLEVGTEENAYENAVLYVPHPWDLVKITPWSASSNGILVIPQYANFIENEKISLVPEKSSINNEMILCQSVSYKRHFEFIVPDTQEDEKEGTDTDKLVNSGHVKQTFAQISPHELHVSVEVVVEVVLRDASIAVVYDSNEDRGIYHFGDDPIHVSNYPQALDGVVLEQNRIPVINIITLLSHHANEDTKNATTALNYFHGLGDFCTVPVFSKQSVM